MIPQKRASCSVRYTALLLITAIPSATTLIALALVSVLWNIPVPSFGIVVATCIAVGPIWFFVTMYLLRMFGGALLLRAMHRRS